MDWWIVFAIFLYFVTAVLILAEIFIPSGGLISICAMACLIGGVTIFFNRSIAVGMAGVGVAVVMIPSVVIFAYKIFPKTRFGKSVTLTPSERKIGDAIPDSPELKEMVGVEGVVVTPLRPVGMCEFEGHRVECVAESGYVENEKKVKVIHVEGSQLTVRVMEEN